MNIGLVVANLCFSNDPMVLTLYIVEITFTHHEYCHSMMYLCYVTPIKLVAVLLPQMPWRTLTDITL